MSDLTQEQKDQIVEVVEQTAAGMFTRQELIEKLEAITGAEFAEHMDDEEGTEG